MSTRAHTEKCAEAWQLAQWKKWPTEANWPGVMDLYQAAAFRLVHPSTIRRACQPDRNGNAELAHQRFGSAYRITKRSLESFRAVKSREAVAA
jgi:hypothetical protein